MSSDVAVRGNGAMTSDVMERVIALGDLAKLTAEERVNYYGQVCQSLGLNPLTRPFDYLQLSGKLTLYPNRGATDQLRRINGVSLRITGRERMDDVYIVTAQATMPDGRVDESTGVVTIGNLKGDALANALMKSETKAKRRATLSIVGLGWIDESEIETVRGARRITVDHETGEIMDALPAPQEGPDSPSKQSQRAPTSDQFERWSRGVDMALQLGLNIGAGIPDLPEDASREEYDQALTTLRGAVDAARATKARVKAAVAAEDARLAAATPAPAV